MHYFKSFRGQTPQVFNKSYYTKYDCLTTLFGSMGSLNTTVLQCILKVKLTVMRVQIPVSTHNIDTIINFVEWEGIVLHCTATQKGMCPMKILFEILLNNHSISKKQSLMNYVQYKHTLQSSRYCTMCHTHIHMYYIIHV